MKGSKRLGIRKVKAESEEGKARMRGTRRGWEKGGREGGGREGGSGGRQKATEEGVHG